MIRRMNASLIMLLVLFVSIGVFAFVRDRSLPLQGLYASGRLFESVWVELLLGFLIAGFVDVLISPAQITAWLGTETSTRGIFVGWMGLSDSRRALSLVSPGSESLENRSASRRVDRSDYRQNLGQPHQNPDL